MLRAACCVLLAACCSLLAARYLTCYLSTGRCFLLIRDLVSSIYKKHFVDAGFTPPARSAFAVAALPLGALVEIECVAACP